VQPDEGPWLVVGLGNPGPRYANNRHNVGFTAAQLLADRAGARFKRHTRAVAEAAEVRLAGARAVLAKPLTYMNLSGGPVSGLARFYKVPVERIVAVHDELDLDYGTLRLKRGGGDNGHNGLRSIRSALDGAGDFYRVRVGVGRPPGRQDPADFLLSNFSAAARESVAVEVVRAADAVESLVTAGLERTQNLFNS
jgi:peptidyl-tRNA hydrolase, PTH1 family